MKKWHIDIYRRFLAACLLRIQRRYFLPLFLRLAVTIVFAVMSNPTAYYLFASVMICVGCTAILGPMFGEIILMLCVLHNIQYGIVAHAHFQIGPKFAQRNLLEPRGRMAATVVMRRTKASGISGLGNSLASSSKYSGFRAGSAFSSSHDSGLKSKGLGSGTFHSTRRLSDEDVVPLGGTLKPRAASDHVRRTRPLSTNDEEDNISESFRLG